MIKAVMHVVYNFFDKYANLTEKILAEEKEALAGRIQYQARRNLERNRSIRTGRLWRSIQIVHRSGKIYVAIFAPYGHYVEFGTSRMAAKPYFWPAVKQEERTYSAAVAARLRRMGGA